MARKIRIGLKKNKPTINQEVEEVTKNDEINTEEEINEDTFEGLVKSVIDQILKDGLPPTPYNFNVYFYKILETKPEELQEEVNKIIDLEGYQDTEEKYIEFEHNVKKGFNYIKNILHITVNLYKNMNLMDKILEKRREEITNSTNPTVLKEIISNIKRDVDKLNDIVKRQVEVMRNFYEEAAEVIKDIEKETIFDSKYNVYNKKYLLETIDRELAEEQRYNKVSALIMITFSKSMANIITDEKTKTFVNKTICKILTKSSRKGDIVAYYGDDVFAMVLKHSNLDSATGMSKRLCSLVSQSNFFLGESEIKLKINIGVSCLENSSSKEIIEGTLNALQLAANDPNLTYVVNKSSNKS